MKFATVASIPALIVSTAFCGPFPPAAGEKGSDAVPRDDARIVAWGAAVGEIVRGWQDVSDQEYGLVTYGEPFDALGPADAYGDSYQVVSLGDGGSITLLFDPPITDGAGADFAVFENSINDDFLELGFVEVSSDGRKFYRFRSVSHTQTQTQVDTFGSVDPTDLFNLAGKYRRGFGTPFDLAELSSFSPQLDVFRVTHVRVVDVVGSINPEYATHDGSVPGGRIINDPWPTPFETGGFDLDAIAVFHQIPEPGNLLLLSVGLTALGGLRPRVRS